MKTKIFSFIMALVMLLTTVTACATKDETPKDNNEKVEYDGLVITDEYRVIRGENADKATVKSAVYLCEQIKAETNLQVSIGTDFVKRGEEVPTLEILVGKTKRETEFDRTTLKEGEYYIGVEGTRVIIDAYDSETLHFAVREFVSRWLTKDLGIQKDGTLLINNKMCNEINGSDLSLNDTILILTQNMRYADDDGGNSVDARTERFKKLLAEYDPDIIGTQETTKKWYNNLKNHLGKDYGIVGCSRDGRNASSGEWSAILYRYERFELLDSDTFWLTNTPDRVGRIEGSLCNRICTWALLKDKQTGKTILMANTHLDHGTDAVRDTQSVILMDYLMTKFPNYPLFITGDFNFLPNSSSYKIVNKQLMDAHDEAIVDKSTVNYTFHSYGSASKEIDFCFFNDKATAISYYIVSDDYDGYVSDHYGVINKFIIK